MADETLYLKDLGLIGEAEISVRDVTLLVGPQASGKSLAAMTLYFMRGMEELLLPRAGAGWTPAPREGYRQERYQVLVDAWSYWVGSSPESLAHRDTIVRWRSGAAADEIRLRYDPRGETSGELNDSLVERIEALAAGRGRSPERQVFVPAGRIIFSFIDASQALVMLSRTRTQWPGYANFFYEKLSAAQKRLFEAARARGAHEDSRSAPRQALDQTLGGELDFSLDPDRVRLLVQDIIGEREGYHRTYNFDPLRFASGQMELWPFCAIALDGLASEGAAPLRIFLEEPEGHLHPSGQRSLMAAISALTRAGQRFVLTTHSPYVVYALNNFLMTQKVLDAGRPLPPSVDAALALRAEQVSAYRFVRGGRVESIMDDETGLILTDELDDPAAELNATFDDLQSALGAQGE